MDGTMVPIKELSEIKTITGPLLIFRDNHARFCAVKFSVRGRDMGTAVAEAQKKVNAAVHLPEGYTLKWTGDFETSNVLLNVWRRWFLSALSSSLLFFSSCFPMHGMQVWYC